MAYDVSTLETAASLAQRYLWSVADRPPARPGGRKEVLARLGAGLPDDPSDPGDVLEQVAGALDPGVVATSGPRYFGFVVGGTLPVAVGAEWLAAAWDQNVGIEVLSPAMAVVEEVTGRWLLELLGLPATASVGFVTGATMANWTGLAAARYHVLAEAGWDVHANGLAGSPPIRVLVGAERHFAIDLALRYLGIGANAVTIVPADDQGRIDAGALAAALRDLPAGPTIVCAQAGNVNSGALDDVPAVCDVVDGRAWVHVDAAVGGWLPASPHYRDRFAGWERADSWAMDAHKGLNVAYDSGVVFCAHPEAHEAACTAVAPYLLTVAGGREGSHWGPESSRRARALGIHLALRQLGRSGVAELVERLCAMAGRFADGLARIDGADVLNDVVTNQVLVRFGDSDERTAAVVAEIQAGAVCWMGPTRWHDLTAMRISVCSWSTGPDDVDQSLAEIERAMVATA